MNNYLSNAFSLQMLPLDGEVNINRKSITKDEIPVDVVSQIGHEDFAKMLSCELGREIPFNRCNTKLEPTDELYVAQYVGGRMELGATCLPPGAEIRYYKITFENVVAELATAPDMDGWDWKH